MPAGTQLSSRCRVFRTRPGISVRYAAKIRMEALVQGEGRRPGTIVRIPACPVLETASRPLSPPVQRRCIQAGTTTALTLLPSVSAVPSHPPAASAFYPAHHFPPPPSHGSFPDRSSASRQARRLLTFPEPRPPCLNTQNPALHARDPLNYPVCLSSRPTPCHQIIFGDPRRSSAAIVMPRALPQTDLSHSSSPAHL